MPYAVVPIGADFNSKAINALAETMSRNEQGGWEFVFAFPVTRTTCLFFKSQTYLMVLRQTIPSAGPPVSAPGVDQPSE